jgi:hypothetical protein
MFRLCSGMKDEMGDNEQLEVFAYGGFPYGKRTGRRRGEVVKMRSRAGFETGLHATVTGGVMAFELFDWSEVASFGKDWEH